MERIILGWSPEGGEENFAVSPKRFSSLHGLSPCQGGIINYLSRYHFEKNPWLLDQSLLLLYLIIDYGSSQSPIVSMMRKTLGLEPYLAPKAKLWSTKTMDISTFCLINGLGTQLLLPLKLICDEPTRPGLLKAAALIRELR